MSEIEIPVKKVKPRKRNYVNNPDFLQALKNYKNICDLATKDGKELPRIPNYIGECIYEISKRIATRKNFSGYPFIQDMIMDGVETCFRYIDRFNTEKYDNPFAFFSTVIWRAFLQRIAKEKKELYIKYKHSMMIHGGGGAFESDSYSGMGISNYNLDAEYMNNYIQEYEDKLVDKKEKIKQSKIDKDAAL